LKTAFETLGDSCERISKEPVVDWFSKSRVALFEVRGEWQCLLLGAVSATHAKAEIYAPVVPALVGRPDIRAALGALTIVILNAVNHFCRWAMI
jgi:hypothetical protein